MIQAVVFDCFGVLAGDGWLPYKEELFKDDPEKYLQATLLNVDTDSGKISHKTFVEEVAKLAEKNPQEVQERIERNPPNDELFAYIRDALKPTYTIGMLSNASENWLDELFQPWQVQLFDHVVLSCDVGYVKPDQRIYQALLNRLQLPAEACLFIDDRIAFCDGAAEAGIATIHYQSTDQVIPMITAHLSK